MAVLLLILAILGLVLQTISILKRRDQERPAVRDEGKLFQELLSGLHMSLIDQRLLKQLARDMALAHPAMILMSPQLFDDAAGRWQPASGKGAGDGKHAQLQAVRQRLFGPGRPSTG